jgi:rare lipoprotein A
MSRTASIVFAGIILAAPLARAEGLSRPDAVLPLGPVSSCAEWSSIGSPPPDPLLKRMIDYAQYQVKHRVEGLASYYSSFFDGRKTANGEIYRNAGYSAAHLTLPLGTWIEVTARANGRKLRMRVNDRGPYAKKFFLDLSRAAARYLGVDVSADRHVEIRIIALPGEEPLPEEPAAVQMAGGGS